MPIGAAKEMCAQPKKRKPKSVQGRSITQQRKSDTKFETTSVSGAVQVTEFRREIGGPGRDRTDDLFHAMERPEWRFVDGKRVMSRLSRQNRPNRR
jgi:hypothetical protein